MPLDPQTHVDAFRAEAERFGVLARTVPHAAPLPHVRRWSVGGVVRHLVGDFRWASDIIDARDWNGNGFTVARGRGDSLLRTYDEAAARMRVALDAAATDPGAPCPNFAERESGTLGWWPRHQAHETLLHRWDIESATGVHHPIDPALAADGVDEAFHVYTQRYGAQRLDRPITLVCTDTDAAWRVSPTGIGGQVTIDVTDDRTAPDLACTAEALLLAMWKRVPIGDDAAVTDEHLLRRFFSGPLTA
jgi:uncharacterized protein (TIGR03083 family)